jgi:hypothetical protein
MILGSDEGILARWAQHFEELLNGNAPKRVEHMTTVQEQGNSETEEPATKRLRNNKAPGIDLIPAELVKLAGPEYVKHLHQLTAKIRITETIPEEWYRSIVCPIHKKGDVMVCHGMVCA